MPTPSHKNSFFSGPIAVPIVVAFLIIFALESRAQAWTFYRTDNSGLPFNTVNALQVDPQDNLWIGTEYGLARLSANGAWTIWQTFNSGIPGDAVRSLHWDPPTGGIWVGTYQNGVALFDGNNSWTYYNTANSGLSDDYVRSIALDSQGGTWFGTAGGLCRFQNGAWNVWTQQNTPVMRSSNISALGVDSTGTIWIGTINGGLSHFSNGTMGTYYNGNSLLTDNTILDLDFDAADNLWLATPTGGINIRQTDGSWSRLTTMNAGLPTNSYYSVCLRENQPFLGAQYHGLVWENDGSFVHYDAANSPLPENALLCLADDAAGRIWIGTYNSGLVSFSPDSVQTGLVHEPAPEEQPVFWAPATGALRFSATEDHRYEVFDATGALVQIGLLAAGEKWIHLPASATGALVLRAVSTATGRPFVRKFLRE
jgi:ligand-binding sensor domain-containing protein